MFSDLHRTHVRLIKGDVSVPSQTLVKDRRRTEFGFIKDRSFAL